MMVKTPQDTLSICFACLKDLIVQGPVVCLASANFLTVKGKTQVNNNVKKIFGSIAKHCILSTPEMTKKQYVA